MKKIYLILISFLFSCTLTAQQTGKVFDNLSLKSTILNMERKYAIYLPPDYENSQRSYPVLYLLHGAGDDQTGWVQFGEVLHIADKTINEGKATPMIIVMPDAKTGRMGYVNDIKGEFRYEDFFFNELIPHIEKTYRVRSDKQYRAVAGLSMGGGGTLYYALHRPDMFSAACPLSAAVTPFTIDRNATTVDELVKSIKAKEPNLDDDKIKAYAKNHIVFDLIGNMPEDQKKTVRWYVDCGDDDFLYEGNALLHIAMRKANIPHEYRVRDGGHTWTYWRTALPEVLAFITQSFHQY